MTGMDAYTLKPRVLGEFPGVAQSMRRDRVVDEIIALVSIVIMLCFGLAGWLGGGFEDAMQHGRTHAGKPPIPHEYLFWIAGIPAMLTGLLAGAQCLVFFVPKGQSFDPLNYWKAFIWWRRRGRK